MTAAAHNRTSILSIVQTILEEGRALELTPRDIALLVLMRQEIESGDEAALAIPYSTIQALHSRLDTIEAGGSQNPERRLTESLTRLVKAECVAKADMTRIRMTADSEYQVTSIGDSVAEWHVMQSEFSGEPLTAIFRAFISQLMRISEDAEKAETENDWHFDVAQQMQHTIKGMLVSIQRHQKELDRQHAALRDFVPTLLIQGSEESIEQCELQLSTVIKTIDDLQEVVLASTSRAQSLIDQIGDLARPSAPKGVENICDEFQRRLLNIAQWTTQRASDWVEHHNVVHNYLRTVVRIDRQRRITDALKRTIARVNRRNWNAAVGLGPKHKAKMPAKGVLTKDWVLRFRPNNGLMGVYDKEIVDLAGMAAIWTECVIPERAWISFKLFSGVLPKVIITCENLGAYIDLPVSESTLVIFSPGADTEAAVALLKMLPTAAWMHFGDLDPEGIDIAKRIAGELKRDVKLLIPFFAEDYLDAAKPLETAWSKIPDIPLLVALKEKRKRIFQEVFMLDGRLLEALKIMQV